MSYVVHSTVRSVHTRTQRAAAPIHYRRSQFILDSQRRLMPGRPVTISQADLERNLVHLQELQALGIALVKTVDGRLMDLSTLQPVSALPAPPLPHPPLDSAKNDPPRGQAFFPAPGQAGSEAHAKASQEKAAAAVAVVEVVEPMPPTLTATTLDEMAQAFDGPSEDASDDVSLEEAMPALEAVVTEETTEVEHVERRGKKKGNRR